MAGLNTIFAALADPTRRAVIEHLAGGEATIGELTKLFPISPPAVSRHLKILEAADLVERTRTGQYIHLRRHPEAFSLLEAWLLKQADR